MPNTDILDRLLTFPAPPCRCEAILADTGHHDPHCLYNILRQGAGEIERLRAENLRLAAMTAVGGHHHAATHATDRNVWVRLMCFWGADGVWNSDDEKAEVAPMGLSPALKVEIAAWKRSLDQIEDLTQVNVDNFSSRALNIGRRIKEEMPSWRVVYIDRTKSGADIRNKDYFEYEIPS